MSWMGFLGRRGDVDGRRGWQEGVLDRGGERGARVLNFVLFFFFFFGFWLFWFSGLAWVELGCRRIWKRSLGAGGRFVVWLKCRWHPEWHCSGRELVPEIS